MTLGNRQTDQADAQIALRGCIFDIKRLPVRGGPGIRTTIFFKGCPLRCTWCHNLEAILPRPELALYGEKCILCGACEAVCPNDVHKLAADNGAASMQHLFYRDSCELNGACMDVCYSDALEILGKHVTVGELMVELRKDQSFFAQPGGGVTVSGGEPLLQHEFVRELLAQCQAEGIHTALHTCGYTPWSAFESVLPYAGIVLYDLKQMDTEVHQQYTGVPNQRILDNLRKLNEIGAPVEIRMPIVPTVNDDEESIRAAGEFLASLESIETVRLLGYHAMIGSKYARVGRDHAMQGVEEPSPELMQRIASWLDDYGLTVYAPESS